MHQLGEETSSKVNRKGISNRAFVAGPEMSLSNIDFHEGYGDKLSGMIDKVVQEEGSESVL